MIDAPVPGGQRTFFVGTLRFVYFMCGPEQAVWPTVESWRRTLNAPGALRLISASVTRRIMIASAGSSELGLVVLQTTHERSAPSKSQPALLVAQICALHQPHRSNTSLDST